MNVSSEVLNVVAATLQEKYGFATKTMLDLAVSDLLRKTQERGSSGKVPFSLSTAIRGMRAMRGETMTPNTAEADVAYCKALSTGATPGSYLVPTIQADEIIGYLSIGGILRKSGARIWPMNGIQKMTVPTALSAPTFVWMAQNSQQTPTDPNLGQMAFDLKEKRALIAIPNQLLATSVPAFDVLLSQILGQAAAESEDAAYFSTATISGAPTSLYANIANLTSLLVGGSANGGALAYSDILAVLAAMVAAKGYGPFAWYMSPRTFFQRVLGLVDSTSRPITVPTATQGLFASIQYQLMGWPVWVSPFISETEANGSGTNQSHIIFTNPRYLHLAQDDNLEIAYSTERYFDSAQTACRAIVHADHGQAPPLGVVVLKGVN